MEKEMVHHPEHYQGKHECIDEMIALFGIDAVIAFCKCNIYKYRFRAPMKNGSEDIQKAENYAEILMDLQKRKEKQHDLSRMWRKADSCRCKAQRRR